ncbi:MAG: hypothetical protein MUF64_05040 [Polyangiaceae bacterium]|nr:hypothetical protein [Polyangiaceae bacterium]
MTPSPRLPPVPRLWPLALLLALLACASTPRYEGQRYRGQGLAFQTGPTGEGWARIEASQGLLAFRDERAPATILVNGRCGLDGDDVPLQALTTHLFLRFTERATEEETLLPFDGREALRTVMTAKLDGVPMRFEALVLKKDGCVYDFILISSPGAFEGARPEFRRFVEGFRAEGRP